MMAWNSWFAFVLVSLAATFSPGPGVMLAIATALDSGARRTFYSSSGNALGVFIVACVAVSGVGLLLRGSPAAFGVLRAAGAAYLIYLGVRQWRSAGAPAAAAVPGHGGAFRRGLLVALGNPKGILFFTAIFPQFMPPAETGAARFLLLMATFLVCLFVAHGSYVLFARAFGNGVGGSMLAGIRRAGGAAFVVMGAAMFGMPM